MNSNQKFMRILLVASALSLCASASFADHIHGAPLPGNGGKLPANGGTPSQLNTIESQIEKRTYIVETESETDILSSKSRVGDPVTARIVGQSMLGAIQLDSTCVLHGRVSKISRPQTGWQAIQDSDRRFKKSGHLALSFDTLTLKDGTSVSIEATLVPQKSVVKVDPEQSALGWRDLKVNKEGAIVRGRDSVSPTKKNTVRTVNIVTTVAAIPLGLIPGAIVKATTGGVMGAVTAPSQQDPNSSSLNPRIKGFASGAVGSLLPVKVVRAVACKGTDTALKRGDKLYVQLSLQ